jgi:hypothetical protein
MKGRFAGNNINEFDIQIIDEQDASGQERFQRLAPFADAVYMQIKAAAVAMHQPQQVPYGQQQQAVAPAQYYQQPMQIPQQQYPQQYPQQQAPAPQYAPPQQYPQQAPAPQYAPPPAPAPQYVPPQIPAPQYPAPAPQYPQQVPQQAPQQYPGHPLDTVPF